MAGKRLNVLVYSGNGSTVESVRHCLYTLRRLLSPNYAVIPVNGEVLIKEPWTASCALLVFPGGADLAYCRTLNGEGNRRIAQYVRRGGNYLGFCAGGYYGSKRCEFEIGDKKMEVVGNRELAFFPGTCRGCAFSGFVYHSEEGTRAAEMRVNRLALSAGTVPEIIRTYYNGGGVFVDAERYKDQGVEVLASFTEKLSVDAGQGAAAVVYCKVGEGAAVLTGPHPEFAAVNLNRNADGPDYPKLVDMLAEYDKARTDFLKACLTKLGLLVNEETNTVPSLSSLHLSSAEPSDVSELISSWEPIITTEKGEKYIKAEADTFHIEGLSKWSLSSLAQALPGVSSEEEKVEGEDHISTTNSEDKIVDYSKIVKRIRSHEKQYPDAKETPYFNHHAFFTNLEHYQSQTRDARSFGQYLLYGEVLTSTSSLLEKNYTLLPHLPTGFTATATVQVAGRGRGSNVWVSPAGSLMFSTCIRHAMSATQAPVVLVQYIAAIAIVEAIKSYDKGYEEMPVRLKWPNDVYARDPSKPPHEKESYVKIGGILVNSSYVNDEYLLVVGIGLNTTNASPTTSLNALLALLPETRHTPSLRPFTTEKLLARILTTFESLYTRFVRTGFDAVFQDMYYRYWLHGDQIITLESENGARCRIKGITADHGLLAVEELGWADAPTGRTWQVQSDCNSFDFLRGLVRRKV
ncbi:MAG: hypothetical protein M1819_001352 [Sarea resinae]|nr:MAG: hypothetical protein M1819_001352 [Sarea resinae]